MNKKTVDKKVIDLFRRIAKMDDVQKDNKLEIVGKEVINIDEDDNIDNNIDENIDDIIDEIFDEDDYQGTDDIYKMDEIELDNFILECNDLLK